MVVWLLPLLVLMGCTSSPNGAINVNKPIVHDIKYPLVGHDGVLHNYRENIYEMNFPQHNRRLTQYCAIHFHWENIKVVYGKDKDGEWGYRYYITKNRRKYSGRSW